MQIGHLLKNIKFQIPHRQGDLQFGQRGAFAEHPVIKSRRTAGDVIGRFGLAAGVEQQSALVQQNAVVRRIVGVSGSHRDRNQRITLIECIGTEIRDRCGNGQFLQIGTVAEGIASNLPNALGNGVCGVCFSRGIAQQGGGTSVVLEQDAVLRIEGITAALGGEGLQQGIIAAEQIPINISNVCAEGHRGDVFAETVPRVVIHFALARDDQRAGGRVEGIDGIVAALAGQDACLAKGERGVQQGIVVLIHGDHIPQRLSTGIVYRRQIVATVEGIVFDHGQRDREGNLLQIVRVVKGVRIDPGHALRHGKGGAAAAAGISNQAGLVGIHQRAAHRAVVLVGRVHREGGQRGAAAEDLPAHGGHRGGDVDELQTGTIIKCPMTEAFQIRGKD